MKKHSTWIRFQNQFSNWTSQASFQVKTPCITWRGRTKTSSHLQRSSRLKKSFEKRGQAQYPGLMSLKKSPFTKRRSQSTEPKLKRQPTTLSSLWNRHSKPTSQHQSLEIQSCKGSSKRALRRYTQQIQYPKNRLRKACWSSLVSRDKATCPSEGNSETIKASRSKWILTWIRTQIMSPSSVWLILKRLPEKQGTSFFMDRYKLYRTRLKACSTSSLWMKVTVRMKDMLDASSTEDQSGRSLVCIWLKLEWGCDLKVLIGCSERDTSICTMFSASQCRARGSRHQRFCFDDHLSIHSKHEE